MNDKPKILVVDDNQDLLETFAMILKRRGYSVQTADNGASAVDKFKDQEFDVTLMDIVMPGMNGVDAFKKIKEIQPGAPIILMTAYSDEKLLQTARNEGVRRIIHKPISIDKLLELINETAAGQPILVVDDDADICETLTKTLELQGYDVITAGSGKDAVSITRKKTCQMAFIDVEMPYVDGLETLLRLKEINPELLVVMMTGLGNGVKEALDQTQVASAITCLYKPFDPAKAAELVKQIGKNTHRNRRVYESK